ncbi:hypothetical protein KQI82_03745 [Oscillibacter sp. MSJ-2]|uniref:Uncharacterized protein n=1 Tax=Dysosmobacter acutus TaxID=2841504 RepID=A0ABS6F9S2_9FIRM|nr:hypothetical protein [Dysosmobacter acutus]MBU5626049.1 hypothetical protein [Dysosmobacter acutus]
MQLSSLIFLYAFLPLTLLASYLTPRRWRGAVLAGANALFCAFGGPSSLLLLLVNILLGWRGCVALRQNRGTAKGRALLTCFAAAHLLALLALRYGGFFAQALNAPPPQWSAPIGLSVYTLALIGAEADVFRGRAEPVESILSFAALTSFFPALAGGVVARLPGEAPLRSWETAAGGARKAVCGLGKQVILAGPLWEIAFHASGEASVLHAWLYAGAVTLGSYHFLSGWADISSGLGQLFGLRMPENFRYPLTASSPLEFQDRWMMSVNGLLRGVLPGEAAVILLGLWLQPGWNGLLWGVLWCAALMAEKRLGALHGPLGRIWVIALCAVGSVVLMGNGPAGALGDLGALVGWGGIPLTGEEGFYQLRSAAVLLIAAALGATPVPGRIHQRISGQKWMALAEPIAAAALLALVTGFLAEGVPGAWFTL